MPKRTDIQSILIIGAGPIIIGQACEFDYSGVQACKALKQEGYRVILVNSNPATIMTDPELADATYIEPLTVEIITKIIEHERPQALLATMGGQTALNLGMKLHQMGILDKFKVEMIGAKAEAIDMAEDRLLFRQAVQNIGLETPRSEIVRNMEDAQLAVQKIGLPAVIRPSFTLGGTGGGIAYNREEYEQIVRGGLAASPVQQVLVEESIAGWKEFEMEVVRDKEDNCIIVCSIENIDPMGVHTGDSITIAPALTLTDKEYQHMRNASIAILRAIGVDTGGSNVQFAINPDNGRMLVIEMNPRVSRSSALASKATGFPIAKIAAKLAVGYTLHELKNDITQITPASFEPTIDYIVTKIPRFAFEKFPGTEPILGTSMKSVGEVMAIGRSFKESIQKALRSLETGLSGFDEIAIPGGGDKLSLQKALSRPTPDRILIIAQALRTGMSIEEIRSICKYDSWFITQIAEIVAEENKIIREGLPNDVAAFYRIKENGFSDKRLAQLTKVSEKEITAQRRSLKVSPVYKRIDTCAAEFSSITSYMYSTYHGIRHGFRVCEAKPSARKKVIILGSGPNRIGQGIEFDYCCVHAAYALREVGIETIMVNCNPETVSTDYDTSDRLYFEPLTAEDVFEIINIEKQQGKLLGVIVQFGGQTPLRLAEFLDKAGIPILGTSFDMIDLAEDRKRFGQLLTKIQLHQPHNGTATTIEEALKIAQEIGFPIIMRPSYVLGGRAMEIVQDQVALQHYITHAIQVSGENPVQLDSYLQNAIEVDVDAIADKNTVFIAGIMEHIEEAGVHSGDAACSLPGYSLTAPILDELTRQTVLLAKKLEVVGLMNIQFAIKDSQIYVLEVNPRASRTVPFVAKASGIQLAKIAARVMMGESLASFGLKSQKLPYVAIKEAVFPFARFPGTDIILGPEMKSTGEVMGIDEDFGKAFAKAQLAAGTFLPLGGNVFVSVGDKDKLAILPACRQLITMGFSLLATRGTASFLEKKGLQVEVVNKVLEGRPDIIDTMKNGKVHLVFNTTEGPQTKRDSFLTRQTALHLRIPYCTTIAGATAAVSAIRALQQSNVDVCSLQQRLKKIRDYNTSLL